jgi:hypothetical protein
VTWREDSSVFCQVLCFCSVIEFFYAFVFTGLRWKLLEMNLGSLPLPILRLRVEYRRLFGVARSSQKTQRHAMPERGVA